MGVTGNSRPDGRMRHEGPEPSFARQEVWRRPVSVELHVEELVLHGFQPGDGLGIGDAVQQELSRMMTHQGLPWSSGQPVSIEYVDAGSFVVAHGQKAGSIGVQLAQNLHRGIVKTQTAEREPALRKRMGHE